MNQHLFPQGFRIHGGPHNPRLLVDAATVFQAYQNCDPRARVHEEGYLSVFQYDATFGEYLARYGSTAGFIGATWAPVIYFDVDRDEPSGGVAQAIIDSQRLVRTLVNQYGVPEDVLQPYISGGKGCHIGLPTTLWQPEGGPQFHKIARALAERIAAAASVAIDVGIYDVVRAFRAPNSRHGRTGLHKRFVPPDQFGLLTFEKSLELATKPAAFQLPDATGVGVLPRLAAEWQAATEAVAGREQAFQERRRAIAAGVSEVRVNRCTLDLIRGEPVSVGDRHRLIFSAALNLAEAGASRHLVSELLREAALDTGLPPRDVDRQIECGFLAARGAHESELPEA